MKWVLKQMLSLAVALTVSTLAAGLIKSFRRYDARAARQYTPAVAHAPAVGPRLLDAPAYTIYQPRPVRTDLAVRQGIAGTAKLSMTLRRDGTISITPVETPPDGLTYWAVEDAKQIKFRPAAAGGRFTMPNRWSSSVSTRRPTTQSRVHNIDLRNRSFLRQ